MGLQPRALNKLGKDFITELPSVSLTIPQKEQNKWSFYRISNPPFRDRFYQPESYNLFDPLITEFPMEVSLNSIHPPTHFRRGCPQQQLSCLMRRQTISNSSTTVKKNSSSFQDPFTSASPWDASFQRSPTYWRQETPLILYSDMQY